MAKRTAEVPPPEDATPAPEPTKDAPAKVEMTAEELDARTQAAVTAALTKEREATRKKLEQEDADRKAAKAKEDNDFKALADAADAKRVRAEQDRDDAARRAQLAEVNLALRDHLATTHAAYLVNAPDIMLHVKEKLAADATPQDVEKLIAAEAKAFVERTPRGTEKAAGGAPERPAGKRGPTQTTTRTNGAPVVSVASRSF